MTNIEAAEQRIKELELRLGGLDSSSEEHINLEHKIRESREDLSELKEEIRELSASQQSTHSPRTPKRTRKTKLTKEEKSEASGKKVMAMVNRGGLVTDREWPIYLFGLTKDKSEDWFIRKVFGHDLNAITLDMLNAVTHKLSAWWRKEQKETGKMPRLLTADEFNDLWIDSDGAIEVYIKESEIRKFLKKNYPKEFIYKHMKRIGNISLEGRAPVAWKRDQEEPDGRFRWTVCEVTGGFADVICLRNPPSAETKRFQKYCLPVRKKGRWKGTEEDLYVVRFIGTWGKSFAGSVLNRRIKMMPERFYRYLSPTAKMLCRVVTGTTYSPVTFNIIQCAKILGWKPEKMNISLKAILVERAWKELVKYFFINKVSKRQGEKESINWTIWKRKEWFYEPEQIKESD